MQLEKIKKENNITSIYYKLTYGHISWWELVHIINVIITKDFLEQNSKINEFIVGGQNKTKNFKMQITK